MTGGLHFDVFVVGATDPSPVAQMHLAARLAEKFHAPAAQIAQAIAARNLRAGQGMDDAQARILAEQLSRLGAQTEFRPSVGGRGARTTGVHEPVGTAAGRPPTLGAGPSMAGPPSSPPTIGSGPTMGSGISLGTLGGGPGMPGTMAGAPPGMHGGMGGLPTMGGPPTMGSDIVGRDPFAGQAGGGLGPIPTLAAQAGGPRTMGGGPRTMGGPQTMGGPTALGGPPTSFTPLGQKTRSAPAGHDRFAPGAEAGNSGKLELGRLENIPADEMPAARRRRELAEAVGGTVGNMASDGGTSGLEAATDAKGHMVRCKEHGLYFDKRTASGCRKCLEPAAAKAQNLAKKLERHSLGFKLMMLREDPVRRSLYGLALALFIGLVPAAVHAMKFGAPQVAEIRSQQAKLSTEIGTQENLEKWQVLDTAARNTHGTNMRNTAFIWMAFGGISLVGWYRLT